MKYLISWNVGYGDAYEVVDVESEDEAGEAAYEAWKEDAESNADYSAEPLTKELAEEHGFEDELLEELEK